MSFLAFLLPGLVLLVVLANWIILREVRKAYPNATRQERLHEVAKAWNSAGLSLATLPKPVAKPKIKNFQIEEEDTPT
jgi:TRAP-type C4-dicarboxylate transport system permease large subunit